MKFGRRFNVLFVLWVVFILVLVLFFLWVSNSTGRVIYDDARIDLSQCLSNRGFVLYGSNISSYSKEQRDLFGEGFEFINYVDCLSNPNFCSEIRGVPAWKLGDRVFYGLKNLEDLSKMSGCYYEQTS